MLPTQLQELRNKQRTKKAPAKKAAKKREPMPKVDDWEKKSAIPWDDRVKFQSYLVVDGASFQAFIDEEFDYLPRVKPCLNPSEARKDPKSHATIGDYYLVRRTLPTYSYNVGGAFLFGWSPRGWRRSRLKIWQGVSATKEGEVAFTTDIDIPILCGNRGVWMSVTPAEIMTQRPGLRYAHGHVLIGGLGLGWFAKKVCERKQVSRVTVVEREQALIDTVGAHLKERFDNIDFITGDAYEALQGAEDRYDSVLYDIWEGWPEADDDPRFEEFAKRARGKCRVWAWGFARAKCC